MAMGIFEVVLVVFLGLIAYVFIGYLCTSVLMILVSETPDERDNLYAAVILTFVWPLVVVVFLSVVTIVVFWRVFTTIGKLFRRWR